MHEPCRPTRKWIVSHHILTRRDLLYPRDGNVAGDNLVVGFGVNPKTKMLGRMGRIWGNVIVGWVLGLCWRCGGWLYW